jgi:hypothetical protein
MKTSRISRLRTEGPDLYEPEENDEPRYTLNEAKRKLIEAECAMHGHDWRVISIFGSNVPRAVTCTRCGQTHEVVKAKR